MIACENDNGTVIQVPRDLDDFIVLRIIGRGSTCVVAEAQNRHTGSGHALKIIDIDEMRQRGLFDKIQKELDVISRLQRHENIVEYQRHFEKDGLLIIVFELCPVGDLLTAIMDGEFNNLTDLKRAYVQILSAVAFLHENNIAHGDIKPENILFDASHTPKLTDFGYCHRCRIGSQKDKSGTLFYAAPQLLRKGNFDTHKADVWSLGITFFAMAASQFPFPDGNDESTARQIVSGRLLWPRSLDEEVKQFLQRILIVDEEARPSIEQIMSDPFLAEFNIPVKASANPDGLTGIPNSPICPYAQAAT